MRVPNFFPDFVNRDKLPPRGATSERHSITEQASSRERGSEVFKESSKILGHFMANEGKELYEFGPFRLDAEKRLLLRNDEPVPLQLKAFDTLLVLVRHSQQVVLKEELMKAVWPDTFVEESNLAQNIFVLRKTLAANSEVADGHGYIATIPGRGYRFAESVRLVEEADALVVHRHSRTRLLIEEKIAQPGESLVTVAAERQPHHRRGTWLAAVAGSVAALLLVAYGLRPVAPAPRVTGIHQITHIGTLTHNTRLITDGPRIYFRVWHGTSRDLGSVSTAGGEVATVPMPLPQIDINDISPTDSEFLVVNYADSQKVGDSSEAYTGLWRVPVPTGSPRPTGLRAREAAWSPDGGSVAYSLGPDLWQANIDGTHPSKIASLPDEAFYLSWAPDGKRIRFSAWDGTSSGTSLWEADPSDHSVRKLIPELPATARPWSAGWTRDGKYFFYTAVSEGTRNIYAIREKTDFFHRADATPVQLTNGPFNFYLALPGKDGKRLFVVADQLRGTLLRYDAGSRQFLPYAQGISADHLTFSPDGQWMAYVEFPEGALIRSRSDGSQRMQLTYPPMRAYSPAWSPDGSQIAFQGISEAGGHSRIYSISSQGGMPAPAAPAAEDRQTYPSWNADGSAILYSSSDATMSHMELRMVDLKSRQVSTVPGTDGMNYGQISPDGRTMIAVDYASRNLLLYSTAEKKSRAVAQMADYPRWSRDGKYVYFNNVYFSAKGRTGGVCRWNAATNGVETLLKYPDFLLAGAYGVSFGVTPDGSILLVKDVSNRDLYAVDLELP